MASKQGGRNGRRGRRAAASSLALLLLAPLALASPADAAPPAPQPPSFGSRLATASGPLSRFRTGDLDGDQVPDLVGWGTANGASVMIGKGDGTFDAPVVVALEAAPKDLRLADLDGDGDLDLLAALGSIGIDVLAGNGDGTFAAPTRTAIAATTIAVAQLTGDAELDVLVGSVHDLDVLPGTGTATLGPSALHWTLGEFIKTVEAFDAEGDGSTDLVVAGWGQSNGGSGDIRMFRGNGDLTYATSDSGIAPGGVSIVRVGDVDGNGVTDLISQGSTSTATLWTDFGSARWGATTKAINLPLTPAYGLALADLDGDGHDDLVTAGLTYQAITVRHGLASGDFGPSEMYAAASLADMAAVDMDVDGRLDIVTLSPGGSTASVILQRADHTFEATQLSTASGGTASHVSVEDLTGDGRPDAVGFGSTSVTVHRNSAPGQYLTSTSVPMGSAITDVAVADVDHDGALDLVASTAAGITTAGNGGTGTFAAPVSVSPPTTAGPMVVADLDGDTWPDVATVDPTVGTVRTFANDGTGAFTTPTITTVGTTPRAIDAADLDGDGRPELIVAVRSGTQDDLYLLRNLGNGTFEAPVAVGNPGKVVALGHGDLDGDGHMDLVAWSSGLLPFWGDGHGNLVAGTTLPLDVPLSGSRSDAVVADVNQDGALDVVIDGNAAYLGTNSRSLVSSAMGSPDDDVPFPTAVVDIDGDGRMDLVGSSSLGTTLRARRATPSATAPWAPFSSWSAAVDQLYATTGSTAPTSAERGAAIAGLARATDTPGGLVARLRLDQAAGTLVDPVVRLYRAYFLRNPDPSGYAYWLAKRADGATLSSISTKFATSSEFRRRYGSLSNAQFVALVYQNVLGRAGEPSGVAYWVGQLDRKKKTRGQVMTNFSESSEYVRKQTAPVTTSVLYLELLHRPPTSAEMAAATALLADHGVAELAREILATSEFAARAD
ncbi:MAG: FG-GAP-like repeat-containing protein [Acidimicrobiales bacterium]